jgi:hypothetical protein
MLQDFQRWGRLTTEPYDAGPSGIRKRAESGDPQGERFGTHHSSFQCLHDLIDALLRNLPEELHRDVQ